MTEQTACPKCPTCKRPIDNITGVYFIVTRIRLRASGGEMDVDTKYEPLSYICPYCNAELFKADHIVDDNDLASRTHGYLETISRLLGQ